MRLSHTRHRSPACSSSQISSSQELELEIKPQLRSRHRADLIAEVGIWADL